MTTFLTNPQQQRHSGSREQQVDYNEGRMEGWWVVMGGCKLWHGQGIEVLSRDIKVGSICRELKEGGFLTQ